MPLSELITFFYQWLNLKRAIYLIILIGFLTYFNFLFNDFVYDDYDLILDNPLVHSIANLPTFFTYFHDSPFLSHLIREQWGNYYRPLSLTYLSLVSLSGQSPFLLNLSQIIFYIINSCLVLIFFKKFLKLSISFILTLFFLVHPINVEVVSHIGIADTLYFLFGMLAINQLLDAKFGYLNKILVPTLLLCSLFAKETGILFLITAIVLAAMFERKKIRYILISSLVMISIYGFFRFAIAQPIIYKLDYSPVLNATLYERIITIPSIIFYYINTLVFPVELGIAQRWINHQINIENFYLPLLIELIFFSLIIIYLLHLWKRKKSLLKVGLMFFFWFLLGLLPHLQFVPLVTIVADRWFYFSFVGILGFVGIVAEDFNLINKLKVIAVIICAFTVAFLLIRTNYRIQDWRNNLSLYEHDLRSQKDNYVLMNNLGSEYMKLNRMSEAKKLFEQSIQRDPNGWINWTNLGNIYYFNKDYQKASDYYQTAIKNGEYELAYMNYGILLITTDKPQEAKDLTAKALIKYPFNFKLWRIIALADKQLGNKKEALEAAEKANSLYTDQDGLRLYQDLVQWSGLTKDFKKY